MVYWKKTRRNGIIYNYLEHSVKIGDNVRKVAKYIGRGTLSEKEVEDFKKKYKLYFEEQKSLLQFKELGRYYLRQFLTLEQIGLIESAKWSYQAILKEFLSSELENFENICYTKYVFNSAQLEGNTLTYEETNLVLNEDVLPKDKSLREIFEVRNYKRLLSDLQNYKGDITKSLILRIHKILLSNIKDDIAGSFRRLEVGIRGVDFSPTPNIFIVSEINKLIKWYNKNKNISHPFELACIFHQRFEEIHPFVDGNGRVGRELFRFILKRNKFPPVFFKVKDRGLYLNALKEGNKQNHKPLAELAIKSLKDDFEILFTNKEKIKEMKKRFMEIFQIKEKQSKLLEYDRKESK